MITERNPFDEIEIYPDLPKAEYSLTRFMLENAQFVQTEFGERVCLTAIILDDGTSLGRGEKCALWFGRTVVRDKFVGWFATHPEQVGPVRCQLNNEGVWVVRRVKDGD